MDKQNAAVNTTYIRISLPGWTPTLFAAVVLHGLFLVLLVLAPHKSVSVPAPKHLVFRLIPPPEGQSPMFIAASQPQAALPPVGQDSIPDKDFTAGGELLSPFDQRADDIPDAELADMLARERDALRAELEQMTEMADAAPMQAKPLQLPPPDGGDKGESGLGPEGAVRELDLSGFPQEVVDDVMKRYRLRVETRKIEAGKRGQSFLSSASKGSAERYFGGMHAMQTGVYEIFLLSRESVALMSRLEEEALRKEGLEPLKARVIRIVFGIVKSENGDYELGVKSLEAEPVE